MPERTIKAIAAMTPERVIGLHEGATCGFPKDWDYPTDLDRFRDLTAGRPVLMGRRTYLSLPDHRRPLPGRINILVSRSEDLIDNHRDVLQTNDPAQFLKDFLAGTVDLKSDELWVIGGGEIYEVTIDLWDELFLSIVDKSHEGNVYMPGFEDRLKEDPKRRVEEEDHILRVYTRIPEGI